MSDFFIGQVMMAGFGFAPKNWAGCDGQLMPILQNQALFSLLGVMYGGNGTTTFALPDMRGRTPVGAGASADGSWNPPAMSPGQMGGVENVTLLPSQIPAHNHSMYASTAGGDNRNPAGRLFATSASAGSAAPNLYAAANGSLTPLDSTTVIPAGGTQPHPNMQPYTAVNFCIALQGIYPSRS